jgi:hypothetical protein
MIFPDELIRRLLTRLGEDLRDAILVAREGQEPGALSGVTRVTSADTLYAIDRVGEEAIEAWFAKHWPEEIPVQITMEGIEDDAPLVFPRGVPASRTLVRVILDPIDGTRNAMFDKRSAWVLAAAGPQRHVHARLSDLRVAVMAELPPTGAARAEVISGIRGSGKTGLRFESVSLLDGRRRPLAARPSQAPDCRHGFASLVKFFPDGKELVSRMEEELWAALNGAGAATPLVFDDQYITTGGQIRELLTGRDRFLADLRPLVFRKLGLPLPLTCHPYDICTGWLLEEVGGVLEHPDGTPLDAPLDTTTPVAWVGYANAALAKAIRPVLTRILMRHLQ